MNAGYCWTCHADHPGEFQTCEDAERARIKVHADAARAQIRKTVAFEPEGSTDD